MGAGNDLTGLAGLNGAKQKYYEGLANPGFDFTGAANIGLSAFGAYNQYKYQNEMMDAYKGQLASQQHQIDRSNAAKDSWSNYKKPTETKTA